MLCSAYNKKFAAQKCARSSRVLVVTELLKLCSYVTDFSSFY